MRKDKRSIADIINKQFSKEFDEIFNSPHLEGFLFQLKAPGTRVGQDFAVQFDIYQILDMDYVLTGDVRHYCIDTERVKHVKYLGYWRVYIPQGELKTTEVPEYFKKVGKELVDYVMNRSIDQ